MKTTSPSCNAPKSKDMCSMKSVILPIIAGLLHLQVFCYAMKTIVAPRTLSENGTVDSTIDVYVFSAYLFDLICCYLFNVVPFSRCKSGKDVAVHHLPVLLVFIPLYLPSHSFLEQLSKFDPLIHNILSFGSNANANGSGATVDVTFLLIDGIARANGYGFISSFNEVIMCFQRAEMSLQGVTSFQDIPTMKQRFFTGRFMMGLELHYKLAIFALFPFFSSTGCFYMERAGYTYLTQVNPEMPLWRILMKLYASPCMLRGVACRVFMITMYPTMAKRTIKKIQQFYNDCFEKTNRGVEGVKTK